MNVEEVADPFQEKYYVHGVILNFINAVIYFLKIILNW
jgi:hypothetical protein